MNYLTADNNILMFLHCGKCLNELPDGVSPKEFSQIQVGWSKEGVQVWCNRHECNVVHIDFEGQKHPANLSASDYNVQ